MTAEIRYRYPVPSTITRHGDKLRLDLSISGPDLDHPWLAEGFVQAAQPAARSLLLVATIAGKRFWTPPNMVNAAIDAKDPVVTTSPVAVRFESFSLCCGVYARFDLDTAALDGTVHQHGTTNVDINPPFRSALSRIGSRDPLFLRVGADELVASTLSGQHVEKRVSLPTRWVRGFAEAAMAMSPLDPMFELTGPGLRRFLESLPTTSSPTNAWIAPAGQAARITSRPSSDAVPATGIERLRVFRELAPLLNTLTAYARPGGNPGSSAWVGHIDGGAVTITLSPTPSRGFSGEGQLLLAAIQTGAGAGAGAGATDEPAQMLEAAAMGRLGYDTRAAEWFERDLPFDRALLAPQGGRVANARALIADDAVALHPDCTTADITSRTEHYRVRLVDSEWHCTCAWWGNHGNDRGPCKHVLATLILLHDA